MAHLPVCFGFFDRLSHDAVVWEFAVYHGSGGFLHQDFHGLGDVADGVNAEQSVFAGLLDIGAEHQFGGVGLWNDDTLFAGESSVVAGVEEAFDFFVDAANGLYSAVLSDGSGHRKALVDGEFGEGGDEAAEFGSGGRVAVNAAVALFKGD